MDGRARPLAACALCRRRRLWLAVALSEAPFRLMVVRLAVMRAEIGAPRGHAPPDLSVFASSSLSKLRFGGIDTLNTVDGAPRHARRLLAVVRS